MFKIRSSKYRHVFCDQPKPEYCWTDFRLSTVTGDQQYIKASAKYFALGMAGGGGKLLVNRLDRPGRFDPSSCSYVHGHAGAVLDIDWSPFDDSMMATASEDTNIKLWSIPDDWEPVDENGNAKAGEQMSESVADLMGHEKKVTLLRWNPTAADTLLSTSGDYTVKVWDVENTTAVSTFEGSQLVHDIVWDMIGDMYAFSSKDKKVRFVDGRSAEEAMCIDQVHGGAKSIKMVYVNDSGKFFTFGASKQSSREIKVWDLKDLSKPLHTEAVDTAAGAMIPLWDADTNVLYLCGKGDGIVRLYEYEDKSPFLFKLNDGFRSNIPGKGYCSVPKRGLNIMKHETARILKVTNSAGVHPLEFEVPRKSETFQDDIYPDTAASVPAHSHAEWFGGSSKAPVKMSLNPAHGGKVAAGAAAAPKKAFKSTAMLTKELEAVTKELEDTKKKLEGGAPAAPAADSSAALAEAKKAADEATAKLAAATQELTDAKAKISELEAKLAATTVTEAAAPPADAPAEAAAPAE